MAEIDIDAPGTTMLMMGNEAIARGALEAGVGFATAYPGTPATEVMESLSRVARKMGIYAEWSANEIVAVEAATGASMAGIKSITSMKQNGVNVCTDFLARVGLTGVGRGGLVLVSGDDPAAFSSGSQQDIRTLARWTDIPVLEPSDAQEAKDMMKWLMGLSAELQMLCILRTVNRTSHASGVVRLDELPKETKIARFDDVHNARKPAQSRFTLRPTAALSAELHAKLAKARQKFESSSFNWYKGPEKPELLILTSGSGWLYCLEALQVMKLEDRVGILKIGTTWPLPDALVTKHLKLAPKVLAIEETDPFIEERAMEIVAAFPPGAPRPVFYGRRSGLIESFGEMNPDRVMKAVAGVLDIKFQSFDVEYAKKAEAAAKTFVPERTITFCPGCPHRATYWSIKNALKLDGRNGFVVGDIGCYTMGRYAGGFNQMRSLHCMGTSAAMAGGMGKLGQFGFDQPVLGVCGDSTFFHAIIPALVSGVWNKSNFTQIVVDNSATAMTGFQPHPGTGNVATGDIAEVISIEGICRSMGIPVEICDPFDLKNTSATLLRVIGEGKGVRVVIMRRSCELVRARKAKSPYKVRIDPDKCISNNCGCDRLCTRVFLCPGLIWDAKRGKATIDDVICAGCGVCADVCPQGAIQREAAQ